MSLRWSATVARRFLDLCRTQPQRRQASRRHVEARNVGQRVDRSVQ